MSGPPSLAQLSENPATSESPAAAPRGTLEQKRHRALRQVAHHLGARKRSSRLGGFGASAVPAARQTRWRRARSQDRARSGMARAPRQRRGRGSRRLTEKPADPTRQSKPTSTPTAWPTLEPRYAFTPLPHHDGQPSAAREVPDRAQRRAASQRRSARARKPDDETSLARKRARRSHALSAAAGMLSRAAEAARKAVRAMADIGEPSDFAHSRAQGSRAPTSSASRLESLRAQTASCESVLPQGVVRGERAGPRVLHIDDDVRSAFWRHGEPDPMTTASRLVLATSTTVPIGGHTAASIQAIASLFLSSWISVRTFGSGSDTRRVSQA